MARISRSLDGLCSMASSRCALYIAGMLMIAGCSKGDDPQTVALIEEHLSPRAIHYENEKARAGRIVGLSLPNQREALEILPHLAKLERLETLTIGTEPLSDDDLVTLPPLPNLKYFGASSNLLSDQALTFLAPMKNLERLRFSGSKVRGPGLAHLKDFTKLEWLELGSTPLGDSGIPHIVENFSKLKSLDLANTDITADGLMLLADLHWLETLSPPANIVGPDPQMGETKQERRRLEKVRQRTRMILMNKFHDAHVASKQKARAAGSDVPPDHRSPFGVAKRMLEAHDRVYDENGRIRPGIQ